MKLLRLQCTGKEHETMKKSITLGVIICFVVVTAVPSFAGPRCPHVRHHPRPHYPVPPPPGQVNKIVHKYSVSYDYNWGLAAAALGVGMVTGALIGGACGPPPPRRVCAAPSPVVVTPSPTVIVQQPATVVVPSYAASGSVAVTVSVLNVRSGPGAHHAVIGQVHQGAVLHVRGSSSGWFYVALPSGGFGWVLAQHTATTGYAGLG